MIKYETYREKDFDFKSSQEFEDFVQQFLTEMPIHIIYNSGIEEYTIPNISIHNDGYGWHREDGFALIEKNDSHFAWYDNLTKYEEEFYDPQWRKRVEIKMFL